MSEPKTKPSRASVAKFLAAIDDERRREDCREVVRMMEDATGEKPKMWGDSIIGFGSYDYKYESGREGSWFLTGVSPRKQSLTLYIMSGFPKHAELLESLGKFSTGKSCLYIKRLEDVHRPTLKKLIQASAKHVAKSSR